MKLHAGVELEYARRMVQSLSRRFFFLAALALAACGDDSDPATPATTTQASTFTGNISGTPVSVAAVVEGDKALVYVCDGHNGRRVDATLTSGAYQTDVAGLGTLQIKVEGANVTGSIAAEGTNHPFTAPKATGKGALLWATGDRNGTPISAGWIVAPDGQETGGAVRGITDGTSNMRFSNVPGASYVEQDNIIGALIGSRAPLVHP